MQRFILLGAYPASAATFRGDLMRDILNSGHRVVFMSAAAEPEVQAEIEATGAAFRPYLISRNSLNPKSDLATLRNLRRDFYALQPDVVLAYTIKPVIWGGIAARRIPRTRFFALITGLGYALHGNSLKRRLLNTVVIRLYRYALKRAEGVMFQNSDNLELFVDKGIVPRSKCHVVNGSGVNISSFSHVPLPDGPPRFLLIARLLGEKGIREYRVAAGIVKRRYPESVFELVGPEDPSPDGIPLAEVQSWHQEGTIRYLGSARDVRPFISTCHVYVLPSYHEGMPRTVLESMAMGRPILTTDVSGCRETVMAGINGWLVPEADSSKLAERIIWFIENRDRWQAMGNASRKLAEEKFDVGKVNDAMLKIMGFDRRADQSDVNDGEMQLAVRASRK